ncbi:ABC transporter permease subunit [Rhizosphaericola mali]|uniref:ABC transporter permease subunit n=2 Tax=Rhizosphaericola mali TaxID=2545455 RepID=A0A5P2G8R7_9BACT|nr:ABC transporter permease subunit [Rhizosphaericola mali]
MGLKTISQKDLQNPTFSNLSVIVRKEVKDLVSSVRFIILAILIILTFLATMYASLSNLKNTLGANYDSTKSFVYLKLLTSGDGNLPRFHVFIGFLGPLLGIALGFDAVNSERNNGTLIKMLSQPIYRDTLLLAKFTSPIIIVATFFLSLFMLSVGVGMLYTGVSIEPSEIIRILVLIFLTVLYVGFWLSISIMLSIKYNQTSTSALLAIGIWLFFSVFYPILLQMCMKFFLPDPNTISQDELIYYNSIIMDLLRFTPNQLYMDATTILLMPSVRSLGPLTMEQMTGTLPSNLTTWDSLLIVWPQLSGLIAVTILVFAFAYTLFMRKEIRN